MQLLLMNDRSAIEREIRPKTRAVAAEARCIPKQNSNDEGRTQDLQIQGGRTAHLPQENCRQDADCNMRQLWTFRTMALRLSTAGSSRQS
jgi:hypothetical protein